MAKRYNAPPPLTIDPNKTYSATLHTTLGDIVVDMLPKDAPKTVNNFVFLARDGFYDNVKFHRIIKGFMVQTGDPAGNGTGGPGYRFEDEPVTRKYERGIVAMANAGPNTNGSQFFITHVPTPWLDRRHSVFGEVVEGYEIVQKISELPRNRQDRPLQEVRLNSVKIERV